MTDRESFLKKFNKILKNLKPEVVKIEHAQKETRLGGKRFVDEILNKILDKPLHSFLIFFSFYLFVTMGFVTLLSASPKQIESLTIEDGGKYVELTGKLIHVDEGKWPIDKVILWLEDGDSTILAEYYPFMNRDLYWSWIFNEKPVKASGKLELKDNQLILNAHFVNGYFNFFFLISIPLLAHYLLTFIGTKVTKWED